MGTHLRVPVLDANSESLYRCRGILHEVKLLTLTSLAQHRNNRFT